MAPSSTALLAAALVLVAIAVNVASAATVAAAGPANLTEILTKGGQYGTFLRLLRATQVGQQIESQLNNSFNGITLFAPTDNAFNNLKAGTLNGLSSQEQVNLVLYHVLPRYYSLTTFLTASNPLTTQASGPTGVYTINVSSIANQVNVTTGVVETQVSNALYSDFPLAVYSLDKVLLPSALFGAKPPAEAPTVEAPTIKAPAPEKPAKKGSAAAAVEAPSVAATEPSAAAGLMAGCAGWRVALIVGVMGIGSLL